MRVDIIDEILSTSDESNASTSHSPLDEQNVTEMRNTNIFRWWDKQEESDLKRVANVAPALPVTHASVESRCTFWT